MRVRAIDVAARAGVSIATVSLVVNGKGAGRVSADTRIRVERAVSELGYVVNPAARSLATGTYGRVALLVHDLVNPFIAAIAAGVSSALGQEVQLLLATGSAETGPPGATMMAAVGVDGVLLHLEGPLETETPGPERPGDGLVPVVVLDEPTGPVGVSRVYFDVTLGAVALGDHLAGLGHRRVVYLDSTRHRRTFDLRRQTFASTLAVAGPEVEIIVAEADLDLQAAKEAVGREIGAWRARGVTAIVTATDVQAYGALAALADAGVAVPGDLSLASFDDNAMSAITAPPLTTVAMAAGELGREAALLLVAEMHGTSDPGRAIALPSTLIIRGSTGIRKGPSWPAP
ncbi:MAG: LacI family DNA-binding transcriptional regulator [Nakamurella sp.]